VPFGRDDNNVGSRKSENGTDTADDAGEEAAAVVTSTEPSQSTEPNGVPPSPPDEEGFVWPEGAAPAEAVSVGASEADSASDAPLPTLDDLVKRIPSAARETLDELFRVKFVGVKRVDRNALKS